MKKVQQFNLIESIKDYFNIQPFMEIMPWIEKNINLSDDVSSERDHPDFSQYPYQIEILKQWEDLNVRKHVIVVSCEQMGKTTMFLYGLLYRMVFDPCQFLICYPSDAKAAETNLTKFEPLVSHIPRSKRRTT